MASSPGLWWLGEAAIDSAVIFRRTTGDMAASVTLHAPIQMKNRGQAAQLFSATSNLTACENAEEKNPRLLFQQGSMSHWTVTSIVATARNTIHVLVLFVHEHLA